MGRKLIYSLLLISPLYSQVPTVVSGGSSGSGGGSGGGGTVTLVNTASPLTGGPCTSTCTLGMPQATGSAPGYLAASDWNTFNNKLSNPMTNVGDLIVGSTSGVPTRLAIPTSGYILTSTGTTAAWVPFPGVVNPMTNAGDIIVATSGSTPGRLGIGGLGQVLTVQGSNTIGWSNAQGLTNPMTTIGDIIYAGTGGSPVRLGIGTTNYVLTATNTGPVWALASGFANPMSAVGDIIVGSISGAASRLGIGGAGTFLGSNGTTAVWGTPVGFANPMTTLGDIILGGASGVPTRYAAGTSGYVFTSNGPGTAPTWQASTGSGSGWTIGTTLPATCTIGVGYFISTNNPNQQLYTCSSTNTWTQNTLIGGSGALAVNSGTGALDIVSSVLPTKSAANTFTSNNNTFGGHGILFPAAPYLEDANTGYFYSPANMSRQYPPQALSASLTWGTGTGDATPTTITYGANGNMLYGDATSNNHYSLWTTGSSSVDAEWSCQPYVIAPTTTSEYPICALMAIDTTNNVVYLAQVQANLNYITFGTTPPVALINYAPLLQIQTCSFSGSTISGCSIVSSGTIPSGGSGNLSGDGNYKHSRIKIGVSSGTLTISVSDDGMATSIPYYSTTGVGTLGKFGFFTYQTFINVFSLNIQ